jgi:branched-chain amino acid transport system substrate-binding protein
MEMAVEEINADGGIDGRDVEVSTYDTGFTPEQGLTALRRAIEDDPTVLMGYAITSQVLAAADLLAQEELPLIHFSAADETNVSESGSDWMFRVKLQNSTQAAAGAQFLMDDLGAQDIGIMYTNDNYGQTARDAAAEVIEDNGGSVVADRSYAFDATDLTEQVTAMSDADAVLNWGFPNTVGLQLNQFLQNGIEIPTMDSDSGVLTFSNELAEPDAMAQFHAAVVCNPPGDDREHVQQWTDTFIDRYDYVPEANSAFTYDSVFLYKMAIEEAGSLEGGDIRDALAGISWDGGVCQRQYRADDDHNLSHDAFIAFFGNGEIETVGFYEG